MIRTAFVVPALLLASAAAAAPPCTGPVDVVYELRAAYVRIVASWDTAVPPVYHTGALLGCNDIHIFGGLSGTGRLRLDPSVTAAGYVTIDGQPSSATATRAAGPAVGPALAGAGAP